MDLHHNLPVQVRDTAEGIEKDDVPQSDVIKEYKLEQLKQNGELGEQYQKIKPNETILRLQRTTPYYKVLLIIYMHIINLLTFLFFNIIYYISIEEFGTDMFIFCQR